MSNRRPLVVLLLSLAVVATMTLGISWLKQLNLSADTTAQVADCDLKHGACAVELADGRRIEFSLGPRPIPLMKPLQLRVTSNAGLPDEAQVSFSGVAMDMGFNQVRLRRQPDGSLAGEATLPVCTTGRMQWQAELRFAASAPAARFRFFAPES